VVATKMSRQEICRLSARMGRQVCAGEGEEALAAPLASTSGPGDPIMRHPVHQGFRVGMRMRRVEADVAVA